MEATNDKSKYPASLTDDQWLILQRGGNPDGKVRFPHLERDKCCLLEKALKGNYNCIGWSVNQKDPEKLTIDPETPIGFEDFYTKHLKPPMTKVKAGDPYAIVDCWGVQEEHRVHMVHASRKVNDVWTSKMGGNLLISHDRTALGGNTYGEIRMSFI
ncbi:hypothetical protein MMC11_007498 [Xylographa trunciseda]|nr:hypothetical protein [Xylographa trunciseda]